MKRIYISLIFSFTVLFLDSDAACVFPSALSGSWYSSAKGLLTINSTSTETTIPSYSTSKFGAISLSCYLSSGNKYVFKSASISYFGLDFEVYLCFVLSNRISARKYIYHLGSVENTDADDERLKSELVSTGATPTVASICDRSSYAAGTEHIFLKNDGNELSSQIRFPYNYRGKWTYTFTSSGTTSCSSDSGVDVCVTEEAKTMVYNYTACSTIQAYSATGILKCMYYTSDSTYTYVHVYNTDTSTDESTTYRFICYVIDRAGTLLYATQYPQRCLSSQTATSVTSPGAVLIYTQTASCPYDTSSTVISTASAAGIAIGLLLLIVIIVCGVLIWYYYKKRKQREIDKLPLQKTQPANKRLVNGDLYRDGRKAGSKTPRAMNGDVKINVEDDLGIRRENSIHISMTSRGGSGLGGLEGGDRKHGVAPVEEPEVNYISDDVIIESENEAALASTFLPITPDERNELHFTDEEIKEIERKSAQKDDKDDDFDMDEIDDELGLPRLSRAFTPVIQPEEATLPAIVYKKRVETETESDDDRRADGIKKVKLKKNAKKKRVRSAKENVKGVRPRSGPKSRSNSVRATPFLDRIKKQQEDSSENVQRERLEKEMKAIENEVIKARIATNAKASRTTPSGKYMVDTKRSESFRSANKGTSAASASGERRRFGDPPAEHTGKVRKKTPRIRHPMEVQGDGEEVQEQKETLKKAEDFWKDERRARSGRRREHPEALTIPSVKEDPFDHKEPRAPETPAFSQARSGKSALGMKMERENSAFIEPAKDKASDDKIWERASSLWHLTNRPIWNNLAQH